MARLASRSLRAIDVSLDDLPLCANKDYYSHLYPEYPRPRWQRIIRFLLARFALNALAALGMLISLVKNIDAALSSTHSQKSPTETLSNSYLWQYATGHPAVALVTLTLISIVFISLIPIGLRMRDDEQDEQLAILRRSQGPRLAEGFSVYLHHVVKQASVIPPILLREVRAPLSRSEGFESSLPFAPLTLAQMSWSMVTDPVLDPPATSTRSKSATQSRPLLDQTTQVDTELPFVVENTLTNALERSSYGCLAILGPQGSGKTSIFRNSAWELAGNLLSSDKPGGRIPIYLDLAHSGVAALTVSEAIRQKVVSIPGLADDLQRRIVKDLLSGPSLILIDGLDELLGSQRQTALDHIRDFSVEVINAVQPHVTSRLSLATDNQSVQTIDAQVATSSAYSTHLVEVAVASRTASYRREGHLDPSLFETWEIQPLNDRDDQLLLITGVLGWLKRRS